jgi:hypothetical protein
LKFAQVEVWAEVETQILYQSIYNPFQPYAIALDRSVSGKADFIETPCLKRKDNVTDMVIC